MVGEGEAVPSDVTVPLLLGGLVGISVVTAKVQDIHVSHNDSLTGQPLHKRGRVWSTSHHDFMLQTRQWASSTKCDQ